MNNYSKNEFISLFTDYINNRLNIYFEYNNYKKNGEDKNISRNIFNEVLKNKAEKYYIFYNELIEWNRKINLTSIIDPIDFIEKHVIDSLMLLKLLKQNYNININKDFKDDIDDDINIIYCKDNESEDNKIKLMDIGSGGGFPGIMLKIFNPEIDLISVESIQKKCNFQKYIAGKFNFKNFDCINRNIYELKELPLVSAITSRAAFNLKELINLIDKIKLNNANKNLPVDLFFFLTKYSDAITIEKQEFHDKILYIDKFLMYKNNYNNYKDTNNEFKLIANFKIKYIN
ncbi:MAG: 16S rRNA (guanine(527)-N(7))-methyltransferase RsmG [bacterium]